MYFQRTQNLIGSEGVARLNVASVAIFGVGGVGSYCAEALARAGVGRLTLIDPDEIAPGNLNRQIHALLSTIGKKKTDVMAERISDVNRNCVVTCRNLFYGADNADEIPLCGYSYVVDAIDTVSSKLLLAEQCKKANVPLISSMGTGNKLHPELLRIADVYQTKTCPLARVMRRELKARGIDSLTVVYSEEVPTAPIEQETEHGRHLPASMVFVPAAAGIMIASKVVNDLLASV